MYKKSLVLACVAIGFTLVGENQVYGEGKNGPQYTKYLKIQTETNALGQKFSDNLKKAVCGDSASAAECLNGISDQKADELCKKDKNCKASKKAWMMQEKISNAEYEKLYKSCTKESEKAVSCITTAQQNDPKFSLDSGLCDAQVKALDDCVQRQ